ncbi:hypothetical protein [Bordetella flabilis]|nr:hypothetical protein [Bordetella flabilis]
MIAVIIATMTPYATPSFHVHAAGMAGARVNGAKSKKQPLI